MLAQLTTFVLAASAVAAGPQEASIEGAVAREISSRSVAGAYSSLAVESLDAARPLSRESLIRSSRGRLGAGAPDWVVEVEALDAAARAGALVGAGPDGDDAAARPEVEAARVRVFHARGDGEALRARLAGALSSPFHAVRRAGLERLARALVSDPELFPALPALAAEPGLIPATCLGLSDALARAGARSRAHASAAFVARARALEGEPLRALEELFDLWIDRPVAPGAVAYLREAFPAGAPGRGLVEVLALVAARRAEVEPAPDVVAVLDVMHGVLALPLDDWDLDERAEQIARRSASPDLGRALLLLASKDTLSARARERCVRSAAWALPMDELLARAAALDASAAEEVWRVIASRGGPLPPPAVLPWLIDPRDGVREAAAREVGRRLTVEGERALLPLVEQLLVDPSAEVRSLAFSWLCETARDASTWGALRAAFDREGDVVASGWQLTERQGRWLGQLPRTVPVPAFRDLVVALVDTAGRRDPAVVELLTPFEGDAEVSALLRLALEDELGRIEAARGYPGRLLADARAAALATALVGVDGDAATEALAAAVRRTMWLMHGPDARDDARPQLPKVACGLLQRTAGGAAVLRSLLGDDVPVRVRYEAALQLSKTAPRDPALVAAVEARILSDYGRVDGTLRARGLEALGRGGVVQMPDLTEFLVALSRSSDDLAERESAIGVMGRRALSTPLLERARAPLSAGVPDLLDVEAAVAAARALGDPSFPDARHLDALLALVEEADRRLGAAGLPELEREALGQLRGTTLISAARVAARAEDDGGPARDRLAAALLRRPLAAGPSDIARRFRGEALGDVRFRWSAEVAAVEAMPALARVFLDPARGSEGVRPSSVVDSRLLVTLGELSLGAGGEAGTATRLLELGLFAMEGEPRSRPATRDLTFGRAALGRAFLAGVEDRPAPLTEAGLWDRAALQAAMLLVDWRQGRIGRAVLEAEFGVADASVRRDPEARLAVLFRVFRGRAALARGEDPARALVWADRARDWARLDTVAEESLMALDAAISSGPR